MDTENIMESGKPSEVIRCALAECRAVEGNPQVEWDMLSWAEMSMGKCRVCVAGAVMRQLVDVESRHRVNPSDFPDDVRDRFIALDHFRLGHVWDGLVHFSDIEFFSTEVAENLEQSFSAKIEPLAEEYRWKYPLKSSGQGYGPHLGEPWYEAMEEMAAGLEAIGL